MKSLSVKRGKTFYLLYNLTSQRLSKLQSDPVELTSYFNRCLQTGLNVCVQENGENCSSSTTDLTQNSNASTSTSTKQLKFTFLCGKFGKEKNIYAVKFGDHPYHYFNESDTATSQHDTLPGSIDFLINKSDKVGLMHIDLNLSEDQSRSYYLDGQFIFKNRELRQVMELSKKNKKEPKDRTANRLVFASGQTNPLLFLNDLEKCSDLKTDKDKMYKILHFVDECHKAEFTKLYFTSDWQMVRSSFLKMYSTSFAENKKRGLQINFDEETGLRSFVERKLGSLSTFTTMPLINQMEIVMNDLPVEISTLFITNEKMTSNKAEILDFCDSVVDLADTISEETGSSSRNTDNFIEPRYEMDAASSNSLNRMEIFDCVGSGQSESDSMAADDGPQPSQSKKVNKRVVRGGSVAKRGRGRPRKKLDIILEDSESSNYDFLQQMDDSSRSSFSN